MKVLQLSPEDKIQVNNCFHSINKLSELWKPHSFYGNGPLISSNPGKTIWLHPKGGPWKLQDNNDILILKSIISRYQKIIRPDIEEEITHTPGRIYLHRLEPGQNIGRHYDFNDQPYMSYLTRFHLYGNIPEGNIIDMDPPVEANSFLQFNHNAWHEYKNNSNDLLFFIVYDLIDRKITNAV